MSKQTSYKPREAQEKLNSIKPLSLLASRTVGMGDLGFKPPSCGTLLWQPRQMNALHIPNVAVVSRCYNRCITSPLVSEWNAVSFLLAHLCMLAQCLCEVCLQARLVSFLLHTPSLPVFHFSASLPRGFEMTPMLKPEVLGIWSGGRACCFTWNGKKMMLRYTWD